jgi:hypothetical protein
LQVLPDWQVPVMLPPGMVHWKPEQQSALEVQVPPCGWQMMGSWQVPLQMPEQHSEAAPQPAPLDLQSEPASGAVVVPGWHAYVSSELRRQEVPAQQPASAPGVQEVPTGAQLGF